MSWLDRITELVARDGAAARIVIVEVTGPTPRSVGTGMLVTPHRVEGRIGRGAIEREAVVAARRLIGTLGPIAATPVWPRAVLKVPTGPVLGEATGGLATLAIEAFGPAEAEHIARWPDRTRGEPVLARRLVGGIAPELIGTSAPPAPWAPALARLRAFPALPLVHATMNDGASIIVERLSPWRPAFHVYGTGLVARALVRQLAELPFDVTWVDAEPAHFPATIPAGVRIVAAADMNKVASQAGAGGFHAVMTASHDVDLAVCRSVLADGRFAWLGVIGSPLKRERLLARLTDEGFAAGMLSRVSCPIGLPRIRSKQPAVIAVSIAAEALIALQEGQAGSNR